MENALPGRRRALALIVAGGVLGLLWGLAAVHPDRSYLFALPGTWGEDATEALLRGLAAVARPPSRSVAYVALHAAAGLLLGGAAAGVAGGLGWTRRVPVPAALLGALVGLASGPVLAVLWWRRGVEAGAPVLAGVALAAAAATGLLTAALAPVLARLRGRALALGALAIALGAAAWLALGPRLPERAGAAEPSGPSEARPLLFVGLDAAAWSNLLPDVRAGRMPQLERLLERGAHGPLQSLEQTLSPVVWTTILTGVEPERHGILDFVRDGVPYTSNSRRAFALWDLADRFGLRSAVHYWWASWPAEEIRGRYVSRRLRDAELDARVAPAAATAELDAIAARAAAAAPRAVSFAETADPEALRARHEKKFAILDQILERDAVVTELAADALREGRYDLVTAYLRGPDAAGHKFFRWHYFEARPRMAGWIYGAPDADQAALAPVVSRVNAQSDRWLGRLLEAAGPGTNVLLVSDHGMTASVPLGRAEGEGETGGHHRSGIVLLAGPDVAPGARIRGATVYDVMPTALHLLGLPVPEDLPGRVLAEAFRTGRPVVRTASLGERESGDPQPIPTDVDEEHLEALRALGYVVD